MDTSDNFVRFGSALDPIEEEEISRKKPMTVADQIATDEQGRRRFHGAFTGGFSAGYYNTVGSKEGWTPSTFKSTRAERAQSSNQNVMDFMDEEDMGAFGIAPQVLRPTDDFSSNEAGSSSRKRPKPAASEGPIPGLPVLQQIIQPVKETIGIKILMRMGWKPGQGVGPRVSRKNKEKSKKKKEENDRKAVEERPMVIEGNLDEVANQRVYGCQLPQGFQKPEEGESSEEEMDIDVLYAPDDVESPLCNPKENVFGLGYKGLERMTETIGQQDLFGKQLKFKVDKRKLAITGEAFGIGAFEEPDEDVYNREDMTSYDFELETAEERRVRKKKEAEQKSKRSKKDRCIDGFHLAKNVKLRKKYFPPPHLPHDFEPVHKQKKSRFDKPAEKTDDSIAKRGLGRHALTVQERQVLLGEEKRPDPVPSELVQSNLAEEGNKEKLRPEDDPSIRERVERIKKFVQVLQQTKTASEPAEQIASQPAFKPFAKNPEKEERYEKYLTLVEAGFQDSLKDLQPPDMTEWEREREKQEFEKARLMYKPLSGIMSSRFVSAKSHDISHIVPEKEIVKEKDPSEDPKVAAKLNLFGKLTHTIVEWHPDKILCRRFNIKDPYPESKFVGLRGTHSSKNNNKDPAPTDAGTNNQSPPPPKKSLFDNLDFSKPPPGCFEKTQQTETNSDNAEPPSSTSADRLEFQAQQQISHADQENKENDVPKKAPLDLFKQIFAESSDSEDENEPETDKTQEPASHSRSEEKIEDVRLKDDHRRESRTQDRGRILFEKRVHESSDKTTANTNRNPGRGIFDNLDLTQINRRSSDARERSPSKDKDEDDLLYGPRFLPGSLKTSATLPSKASISSQERNPNYSRVPSQDKERGKTEGEVVWVEKEVVTQKHSKSKKHSSKKSKKSKKTKTKDKHKSKKSKKEKSKKSKHKAGHYSGHSESSSSSSDESSSSVEIHGSLNQKALLAQLKHLSGSQ